MFWGLIMEPNKRYTQTVEKAFHVSMATLDDSNAVGNDLVQVMACYEGRNYLLCNLKKDSIYQVPLDLNFEEGTKIAFTSNGRARVHLTGYVHPDTDMMDEEDLEEEDDEEVEEEEIPQLAIAGKPDKRKAKKSPENAKQAKRQKAAEPESDGDESDDDEDEEESQSNNTAEPEDSDDDDDSEEDIDEEEDEEEEEEEVPVPQPTGKKNKQKQQQQQAQQNNQKPGKKSITLANGTDAKQQQPQQQAQKKKVISGGVQVEELAVGNGAPAKPGKFVTVYYVGKLKNGKKFDSTTSGTGFRFRLGKGEVIKGWDAGVQGMKVGGKRRLTIPPAMAYGAQGSPPVIPPNSTLIFEVELKKVN